jgi:hypothetical protein
MRAETQDTHRHRHLGAALALALAGVSGTASAETPGDSYWAEFSYFYPNISSTARLDLTATHRPGTVVTLEDDLNLTDRKGTPYLTLGMRLGQPWRLEFEYYQLNRSGNRTILRQIDWGDTTFPVGANVSSTFDTTVYRFSGGYSFYREPTGEAGVSFGLHVTDFKTALSGTGTVGGAQGGTASFRNESRTTLVPLPTVGVYGSYKFAEQWQVRGKLDYLSLTYQEYSGSLTNALVAIDWRFAKNFGAGIGYRGVNYNASARKSSYYGEIDYRFRGPTFFLNAGW